MRCLGQRKLRVEGASATHSMLAALCDQLLSVFFSGTMFILGTNEAPFVVRLDCRSRDITA